MLSLSMPWRWKSSRQREDLTSRSGDVYGLCSDVTTLQGNDARFRHEMRVRFDVLGRRMDWPETSVEDF